MSLAALLLAATVSKTPYEVSTHRAIGQWAVDRSILVQANSPLKRLRWDLPEATYGGPSLTELNLALSDVKEPELAIANPASLIVAGCATEDAFQRYFRHFLDGQNFSGLFGLFMPSDVWVDSISNGFSWTEAQADYVAALTAESPLLREDKRVQLFRSLGQVLHLIQDAHQPSHVRNDSHAHRWYIPDGWSALEYWAKDRVSLNSPALDPNVLAAVNNTPSPTYRTGLNDYLRGPAIYANRKFFSDDTIWHNVLGNTYPEPNGSQTYLATEGTFPFTQSYIYASATLHNQIPPMKMARQRSGLRDLLDSVGDPKTYTLLSPNDAIVRQHAATLIPKAVSECAGAINHFFRLSIQADIDTSTVPGEGRLKLTNVSSIPGATDPADLTLAAGATMTIRYETETGRMLPLPGLPTPALGLLAPGAPGVTLPINILSYLQQLTDSLAFPDPNVRARSDMRFVVVLEGIVGTERAVGADLWWKSDCPEGFPTPPGMVKIFPGTFQMGSNAANGAPYYNEWGYSPQPVHQVTLSQCFWMGATEVTQAQYQALMGTNPSYFPGANNPVERVSWNNAVAYCAALTTQQAALGNVPAGYQYRLPTEAEWEYACRAGTTTEFNTGAALFCSDANFGFSFHSNSQCYSSGSGSTVPVGSYAPNAWGLYDMHGNVREWCLDSVANYPSGAVTDPFVTGVPYRVIRGGSWYDSSVACRSAFRSNYGPGRSSNDLGFRVVLAPVLVP